MLPRSPDDVYYIAGVFVAVFIVLVCPPRGEVCSARVFRMMKVGRGGFVY